MSEKYGRCKLCLGVGEVVVRDHLLRPTIKECASCRGTGHSGDATAHPAYQDDWNRAAQDLLESLED